MRRAVSEMKRALEIRPLCSQCHNFEREPGSIYCSDTCRSESDRDWDADRRLDEEQDREMRENAIDRAEYLIGGR